MTHTLQSARWLGFAALTCAALLFFATRLRPGPEAWYLLAIISLLVTGIYCGVRGLFSGTWFNRICAAFSVVYLIWMVYFFLSG